ncbi:MAG: glycosyltransferase family 2 protein [Nanoarchaeota archaeon]|nr:glycosyltransferase family 2 protein [Nanoarchaeota archaeon]MBU1005619.1 glycosyltransferase family 2 protein [Nanoarchaeota archaeon]MBU1946005.1 glycosyltransferase family 2 protein [Nanoarchaeota archaeon]
MKPVICLPTRNEKENVQVMIDEIKSLGYDFFISDANSTDGTIGIAKKNKVPIYQRDGKGKGFGIRKALQIAKEKDYDILVLIDCDQTYPVKYIPKLLNLIEKEGFDMVVGARSLKEIKPFHRLPNKIHTLAINLLYGGRLKDINSGLRAFKVNRFKKFSSKGFDIEAEITVKALKNRLKIKEIPIDYKKRVGHSKIKIKDGFLIFWRIIKERFSI